MVWFVFVFLMFVALATTMHSFGRLLVLALLSLPVFYLWQMFHQFDPSPLFLAIQFGFVVLSSQAALGCVLGYHKLRNK